nr:tol-pal system-associated acyl-CoA thioesterase [Prosthecomicrobium pneumaticum]
MHRLPVRIYFEDTDFTGIVYHASYLRFLERGRTDFLRVLGIHHSDLDAGAHGEPLAFVVRRMTLDYLRPARIDDVILVETRPAAITGARMEVAQRILRDDTVLIEAAVTVVLVGRDGRPRRVPKALAERLAAAAH